MMGCPNCGSLEANYTPMVGQFECLDCGTRWHDFYKHTPGDISPRASLLREAESLITGDRNKSYGPPTENFQNTADIWNVQFKHLLQPGRFFTAANVAQAMISLKLARMVAQPKRDSYVDIAGYAACGWESEGVEE